ncbi:unnamed protein product [Mytilus coruscus]|uniref:Helitron helicase-like domain-containing protein n=1 Tax=Mytilus coruscus TaxID=42192 RepID=A0A6J8D1Y8_MYTCO|nr:unnamed protein product [Mytilus coruscus]
MVGQLIVEIQILMYQLCNFTHIISCREITFNILLRGGRLLQQYIVDMFAMIEQLKTKLYHQNDLRAELYQGLNDAVHAGDVDGVTVGRKIILPSSFSGSPRNMHEQYQDAMSIVRRYGKPDLFITFTCNPKWPEILHSLLINQTPADRPDLIARVFKQKLQMLLHDITQNNVFGKTIAYVYVNSKAWFAPITHSSNFTRQQ